MLALGAGTTPGPRHSKPSFAESEEQPVKVELIAEHGSVRPGGSTQVGVHFDIEKGWHIYAQQPGEAGLPTSIAWRGPESVFFIPMAWPAPKQLTDPGNLKTFGYTGALVLASRITVSKTAAPATTVPIQAHVEWLACKALCLPGSADLTLSLPVASTQ